MKRLAFSPIRVGFLGFVLLAWVLLSFPSSSSVQQWARAYIGASIDEAYSIQQTRDGGYIVAGYTRPSGRYDNNAWVLKLDAEGSVEWQEVYGGRGDDVAYSIQQTSDGGYIVAGWTNSFRPGGANVWVLKLDAKGNVEWQKIYGGDLRDIAYSIQQTRDGGYIVAGETSSFGLGDANAWVLKLDVNGNLIWQKAYGGGADDVASYIQQTSDGGHIVAGYTKLFSASGYHFDAWIFKLDANGNLIWQKTYGLPKDDRAFSIQQTRDGGYIVAGYTGSFGAGWSDAWVLKLNANGDVVWQKTYGGSADDIAYSIQQTRDGGYIVAGWTASFGAGGSDAWILKLNANGDVVWQKTYGGSAIDVAYSIQQTRDGGYIVAGYTDLAGYPNSPRAGLRDFWILRLDANGNVMWQKTYGRSDWEIDSPSGK